MICVLSIFSALLGSTAPSPLYPIFVERWALRQGTITAIFSVYALGTLLSLVVLARFGGRVRDPRRILFPALLTASVGAVLFAFAPGVSALLLGRFLAGVATGAITGIATSALYAFEPAGHASKAATVATLAFTGGAALGPVVSAAAIAINVAPTTLPLLVIATMALVSAVGLCLVHWPRIDRADALKLSVQEPRTAAAGPLGFHRHDGTPVRLAHVTLAVAWMLGSLLMAVGASVATQLFGLASPVVAGLMPALFQLSAGFGQFVFGGWSPLQAIVVGLLGLATTQSILAVGSRFEATGVLIVAVPFCGLFYGAAFVGAAGLVAKVVAPGRRTAAVSRFYTIGYLSNAVPVFGFGVLADAIGLSRSFLIFSCLVAAMSVFGIMLALPYRRRAGRSVSALS